MKQQKEEMMMKEEQIEEILKNTVTDDQKEFEQQIRRGIRNNIYRRAVIAVIAVLVMIGIVRFGVHAVKEQNSFHLSDWKPVVSGELVQETMEKYHLQNASETEDLLNAQVYISAYSDIFFPGMIPEFSEPAGSSAHAVTYGTYEIGGKLINYFEVNPENEGYFVKTEDNDSFIRIENGKIIADQSRNILNDGSRVLHNINAYEPFSGLEEGDYYSHFRNESTDYKTTGYIDQIYKLPASALICLDIRLKEPVSVYNLLRASTAQQDSRIVYAVTDYIPESDEFDECAIGFSLIGGNGPNEFIEGYESLRADDTLRRDKKYFQQGMFYYNNRASFFGEPVDSARVYEERYRIQLKLLIDNQLLNEREKHAAETALRNSETDGVEVIGYRIFASRDEAVNILKRDNTLRSHIVSVKFSRFEQYGK